jgi:hypothetical protein
VERVKQKFRLHWPVHEWPSSAVWAFHSSSVDSRSACDARTTGYERRLSNSDVLITATPSRRRFATFQRKDLLAVDREARLAPLPIKLLRHLTLVKCGHELILACGLARLLTATKEVKLPAMLNKKLPKLRKKVADIWRRFPTSFTLLL